MTEGKPDVKLKIVVAGSGGVGKTTIVHRFLSGQFLQFSMTIGVSFQTHTVEQDDKTIKLIIWDLGGQERFKQMSVFESYATGAHGILLALDLTDTLRTLQELSESWIKIVRAGSPEAPIVLIGTKADLKTDDIDIPQDLVDEFIQEHQVAGFFETSSLTGKNVKEAFIALVNNILNPSTGNTPETAVKPLKESESHNRWIL